MRAALAAEAAKKKGPAAAILAALLSLLDLIVALLADFKAGRLAAASPAWAAAAGTREGSPPQPSPAARERETLCRRSRTRRGVEAGEPRTSYQLRPLRRADERSVIRQTLRSTRPEREPGGFRPPNRIAHGRPRWPPDRCRIGLRAGAEEMVLREERSVRVYRYYLKTTFHANESKTMSTARAEE